MDRPSQDEETNLHTLGGLFPPTAWSRISAVTGEDEDETKEALEELCRRYWHPARKFLRSLGCSEHNAEDLTQKFFSKWANPENFQRLDREKGRLRSYMKQGLRHTFINDWRASQSHGKGEAVTVSIDSEAFPEGGEGFVEDADWVYDTAWAEAVMLATLGRLRAGYTRRGRGRLFDELRAAIPGGGELKPYAEIGVSLGMTEPRIKLEVHRLRRRFADELRAEVAATLADPAELDDELRHLVRVMIRAGNHTDV
jgi:RNA polymerase sigma-70 factor (ECF subfamily)